MLDHDRNHNLIASTEVNGTRVYGREGTHVGDIDHLIIDKKSGKIVYAIMSFGGFLGLGEEYHPIPWAALSYDTGKAGFVTDITEDQLKSAPPRNDDWYHDRRWEEQTLAHYGVPFYWI